MWNENFTFNFSDSEKKEVSFYFDSEQLKLAHEKSPSKIEW